MTTEHDPINHPKHYSSRPADVECIDIARHLPYNLGCAFKYVWRAGIKDTKTFNEDLDKAAWYIKDQIANFGNWEKQKTAFAIWQTIQKQDTRREWALESILDGDDVYALCMIQEMQIIKGASL